MHFSWTTWALTALTIGQAAAMSLKHRGHAEFHNHAQRHTEYLKEQAAKRSTALAAADAALLTSLGAKTGINSYTQSANCWIGSDGPYTNEYVNAANESIILVVWGPWGSWVNANTPLVTYSLPAGQNVTLSFANGAIGAWSAVYPETTMVNGQISNTWGEYTFSFYGVVDVSREVNMAGRPMSIVGPQCTTNMNTCVFVCAAGNTCTTGYVLENCENGSQAGATYGLYQNTPSGGCGGLGNSAHLVTTFS